MAKLNPAGRYLVLDLEATCWGGAVDRGRVHETIEIGAVLYDAASGSSTEEFQSFVRPVEAPKLSSFCTELTSICQAQVDGAPLFPEALERLLERMSDHERYVLASWGRYDKNQLLGDCALHRVPYPFGEEHVNLKKEFSRVMGCKPVGLSGALKLLGLGLEGTHHRGIDDARNITKLLGWLVCAEADEVDGYVKQS